MKSEEDHVVAVVLYVSVFYMSKMAFNCLNGLLALPIIFKFSLGLCVQGHWHAGA